MGQSTAVYGLVVAAALMAGCGPDGENPETGGATDDPTGGPPTTSDPTDPTGGDGDDSVSLFEGRNVDVLFVIDNSGSMAEEQARLGQDLAAFLAVFESPELPVDYRIAVTTTDSGNPRCPAAMYKPEGGDFVLSSCLDRVDAGEFTFNGEDFAFACSDLCDKRDADLKILPTATPYDPDPAPRSWVERTAGLSNIQGAADNLEALRCYLPQGVAGCGFESHLESMYLALAQAQSQTSMSNYGFLREDARLAVVMLSDEGDCSGAPIAKEIFTTNKVFWTDPEASAPTSALCWNAGVACSGGPGVYSECHPENYDVMGQPGASDADAVLHPVARYIDFVAKIDDQRKQVDPTLGVHVALIGGVPAGYDRFESEIPYEDSPDGEYQDNFGIGPGCLVGDPGFPDTTAVPPVRERVFAEAFVAEPVNERNLYSICEGSYQATLASIAEDIVASIRPTCFTLCAADSDPSTPVLEPSCTLTEYDIITDTETTIPPCDEVLGVWVVPAGATACFGLRVDQAGDATPSQLDDMSPACADEGYNLEFQVVRAAPAPKSLYLSASCQLSTDRLKDCPLL